MRIQKVLIAMLLLLAGGMAMHAQNARASISDSSLSLGELINQIEKQTDYLFVMGGDIDKSVVALDFAELAKEKEDIINHWVDLWAEVNS